MPQSVQSNTENSKSRRHEQVEKSHATLSHMEIGVRDLRNRTARVIDAVKAGERVVLTVNGEPTADIVPHGERTRWLAGTPLREQLADRAADPSLRFELEELAGQTLDEL
jgi:prevent-host-death family protein